MSGDFLQPLYTVSFNKSESNHFKFYTLSFLLLIISILLQLVITF